MAIFCLLRRLYGAGSMIGPPAAERRGDWMSAFELVALSKRFGAAAAVGGIDL